MMVTVSEYIAKFLKANDVKVVFELSGGMIMHLMDAIEQEPGIGLVNVYHEQAAAIAADTVGRISNIPGVALGTSGPGAINLLTGIGSSYFDSAPTLFITGQVNRHEQKGAREIRQLGFQETDIVSMAKPITKWAERLTAADDIKKLLPYAFALATKGRPGPCLLDIPMDLFRAKIEADPDFLPEILEDGVEDNSASSKIDSLLADLKNAQRPLMLAGHGVQVAGKKKVLREVVEKLNIPVVTSLLACDLFPYDHPLRVGMIGTYGNRWANHALAECDMLIVLGSRLDIRQTGADTASFASGRKIYHVDIELAEINNRVQGCISINSSLQSFFDDLSRRMPDLFIARTVPWLEHISELRQKWPDISELKDISGINPNSFMHRLSHQRQVFAYTVDVGLHQMWAAQSLELDGSARFITSGGMGAMGFALPSGIAAAIQSDGQMPVVVIAGDAGFQLNIQELQSVVHLNLPIKIVVMNNRSHGMTRQFQDTYFNSRYAGTVWGYSAPNFVAVAEAYGINAMRLEDPAKTSEAIDWLWADPLKPMLLEVIIDQKTNCYPKMAFGRPISEMEPFAVPMEMEGT